MTARLDTWADVMAQAAEDERQNPPDTDEPRHWPHTHNFGSIPETTSAANAGLNTASGGVAHERAPFEPGRPSGPAASGNISGRPQAMPSRADGMQDAAIGTGPDTRGRVACEPSSPAAAGDLIRRRLAVVTVLREHLDALDPMDRVDAQRLAWRVEHGLHLDENGPALVKQPGPMTTG